MAVGTLPRYNFRQTYAWNYEHAPAPELVETLRIPVQPVPGEWRFCGLEVPSPLGMPAGPLLNGRWCLYYAALGFDVVTYKTVRSRFRACYDLPNLQPVLAPTLWGGERDLPALGELGETAGSWAVSFGMPSMDPEVWRRDVAWTRKRLAAEKVLSVSVVGTMQPGWSLEDLAEDYALCARWAVESGADCVEANLSCPNVQSRDGQLYQISEDARRVSAAVRDVIGRTPLILKIGHVPQRSEAAALVAAVAPYVQALSMVNCIPATVLGVDGLPLFNGETRGIGGPAIREASTAQVARFAGVIRELNVPVEVIGVGGAGTATDVLAYLEAGAGSVHLATAAMRDPEVGIKIRRELAERSAIHVG